MCRPRGRWQESPPDHTMLESPHDRRRAPHPVSTLRRADGDARPGARDALDTGPVLGLPEMWSPFLVNLLDANRRQAQAGDRTGLLAGFLTPPMPRFELNDDPDDDPDEDEDFDEDDEASDDDEDEDKDGEDDVETWQVTPRQPPLDSQP